MQKPVQRLSMTQPLRYRIVVQGRIDKRMAGWFSGLEITPESFSGGPTRTSLVGTLADQAALMGLLRKLYDRGHPLLSVACIRPTPGDRN